MTPTVGGGQHLPECLQIVGKGSGPCICWLIRACEQRSYTLGIEVGKHDGWVAGHAAGVQAARDAVEAAYDKDSPAVQSQTEWGVEIAVAAIEALGGER